MPDYMAGITWGQTAAFIGGALIVVGVFWKIGKPIKKFTNSIAAFMATWNGTPEVLDDSGAFVKAAVPGIPAQLETIRAQVQNSHKTNLRDDFDDLKTEMANLSKLVTDHIVIAKASDDRQDETERIVTKYLPALRALLED